MSSQGWWKDIQDAARGTTGGPPKPPSKEDGSTGKKTHTAPSGPYGGSFPEGTVYTVNADGSLASVDYRPPAPSGGGSGAVSVSLNPNSTAAWGRATDQAGNIWMVNELDPSQNYILFPATPGTSGNDPDGDGYDNTTGLPNGVVRVSQEVSPTGLVYRGIPVKADGSKYTGGGAADVPGWSNVTKGPGGMYGINNKTGTYGIIPGSEALGSTASNQPATYSGGGGGSGAASAYSSIATAQINAASRLAAIDAEAQARNAQMQLEAQLSKELKALDQNFQREMAAIQNTLSAAGLQAQIATANAQLAQAYQQNKIAMVGQFREALMQFDARAVYDAMMEAGSLSSALNQMGSQGFLTENANAPAAALLGMIRQPFEPIPEPAALQQFLGGAPTGGMTGGLTGGTAAAPGGGSTGGPGGAVSGGTPATMTGGLGTAGGVDLTQFERDLRAQGLPAADIEAIMREMAQGQRAVNDYALSQYYRGLGGSGQFLRSDGMGGRAIAGEGQGGMHTLLAQGDPWYSGVWQTSDPYAPNYKSPNDPMFLPSWAKQPTSTSGMAGAGGDFVPPTEPIPANHPLAGGLTGGQVANPLQPQAVIPMLANGGSFRGAAVVGEAGPELMIAPQGADVIPLTPPMAGQLMGQGMPGLATGTLSGGMLSRTRTTPTYYEPAPTATTGGSVTTSVPSTTTQAAPPVAPPVVSPTSSPAPPVVAPTPAAPAATTTPAQPAAQPTQPTTPTTPLSGALPQPSQDLLDEIMADRVGTANMGINPYDVGFANLPPWIQELFFQNEAQRTGTPAALYAQDVARRQLVGALSPAQGY